MPRIELPLKTVCLAFLTAAWLGSQAMADGPDAYLAWIHAQANALRADDTPPKTLVDWQARKAMIRSKLLEAWGGFPAEPCPLDPRVLGTLQRDGYRVEKIIFQTRPGVWMTANAYVPDRSGKRPAILGVHGH